MRPCWPPFASRAEGGAVARPGMDDAGGAGGRTGQEGVVIARVSRWS